jgi:hypothetical protein
MNTFILAETLPMYVGLPKTIASAPCNASQCISTASTGMSSTLAPSE